jgi:hypothetical protein
MSRHFGKQGLELVLILTEGNCYDIYHKVSSGYYLWAKDFIINL